MIKLVALIPLFPLLGFIINGFFGKKTLESIKKHKDAEILELFKISWIDFYNELIKNKPQNQVFLKGWLYRVNKEYKDK